MLTIARKWAAELRKCPGVRRVRRKDTEVFITFDTLQVKVSTYSTHIGHIDLAGVEMIWDAGCNNWLDKVFFEPGPDYPYTEGDTNLGPLFHPEGGYSNYKSKKGYRWWICFGHDDRRIRKGLKEKGGASALFLAFRSFIQRHKVYVSLYDNNLYQKCGLIVPVEKLERGTYAQNEDERIYETVKRNYANHLKRLQSNRGS